LLATAPEAAGTPDALSPPERDVFARFVERARKRMPAPVIDMSGFFDDVDEPVFIDLFHNNERGAELMADGLFDRLRPQIDAASRAAQERDG
jgi:hypothetical protein